MTPLKAIRHSGPARLGKLSKRRTHKRSTQQSHKTRAWDQDKATKIPIQGKSVSSSSPEDAQFYTLPEGRQGDQLAPLGSTEPTAMPPSNVSTVLSSPLIVLICKRLRHLAMPPHRCCCSTHMRSSPLRFSGSAGGEKNTENLILGNGTQHPDTRGPPPTGEAIPNELTPCWLQTEL